MQSLTAVVLGATGLTGEQLVRQLLNDPAFSKVRILVRRPVKLSHSKLETAIVDFDDLAAYRSKLGNGNCIFCCIGTTLKQVKGDRTAYRKIDFDIAVNAAKMGKDAGFTKYLLISSVGANAASKNFYLQLKGAVEKEIAALNYVAFHVFRPGVLLGERKQFRLGETIAKVLMQGLSVLFLGSLRKFRAIAVTAIAKAMLTAAKSDGEGMFAHHYDDMIKAGF